MTTPAPDKLQADDSSARASAGAPPWLALVALALLFALVRIGLAPPAAKPASASTSEFSAERAATMLERVIGTDGKPHPAGSAEHARVRERLIAELTGLGYEPSVQEALVDGGDGEVTLVRNVLARAKGASTAKAVLLCAHYDSVAAGPGASDDGAGVAALLEIARALRDGFPRQRDVIFLFDDAEELGLQGARAFVGEHPWAKDVAVVVNLEARGTSGPSMMFETSANNRELMRIFARSVRRPVAISAAYEVYKRMPNDTDLSVFKEAGFAGYNFAFLGGGRQYHTPLDDLAHLSRASLQHHGDNALSLVQVLANETGDLESDDDAVYADVLGVALIAWPTQLSPWLAGGALAAIAVATVLLVRSGRARAASVLAGVVACGMQVLAAATLGFLLVTAVTLFRNEEAPWGAEPLPLRALLFGGAALAALALARIGFVRRAGFFGLWCGTWLAIASIGLVLALTVPSTCYLFVVPAILAAVVGLFASRLPTERANARAGQLVLWTLVPLALLWFPLVIGLELSFELHFAWLLTAPLGLLLAACTPSFATASSIAVRTAITVIAAVCVLAFGAALVVPARSADAPEVMNLVHYQDSDAKKAIWQVVRGGADLRVGPNVSFDGFASPPPGWLAAKKPPKVMAAAVATTASPEITTIDGSTSSAADRRIRARVRAPRGALELSAVLPPHARVVSLRWRDHTLAMGPYVHGVRVRAIGTDEVEIEVAVQGSEPVEAFVFDVASEMPPEATAILADRPPTRVPRSLGDASIVVRRVTL